MAAPSDDRNGVVVNRAIDSTRGIPNCLVEERCSENRSSEIHAKSEYEALLREYASSRPKIRISTGFLQPHSASQYILEQKINFYEAHEREEPTRASLSVRQFNSQ